jgi:ankyrin repeat protein
VTTLPANEPPASTAIEAIQTGDLEALKRLLEDEPDLATARIARRPGRTLTLLHVATDWPGHFPNGSITVARLIEAGADTNARSDGANKQTPLHWAASSDDVEVLDALLDAGADIEAPGAFNGVGGPLDNAVAFGQWAAARRLVERGARTGLWQAAALGLTDRIEERFADDTPPPLEDVTEAFWQACHGGQQQAAEYLLERGADLNWIGYDDLTPLDTARRSNADQLAEWLSARGGRSATEIGARRPES